MSFKICGYIHEEGAAANNHGNALAQVFHCPHRDGGLNKLCPHKVLGGEISEQRDELLDILEEKAVGNNNPDIYILHARLERIYEIIEELDDNAYIAYNDQYWDREMRDIDVNGFSGLKKPVGKIYKITSSRLEELERVNDTGESIFSDCEKQSVRHLLKCCQKVLQKHIEDIEVAVDIAL